MKSADARDAWNRRYATSDYVWKSGANQFVERHLSELPPGRAIDLGAGEGRNAVWLATKGWQVTAVDFSSVGLEKGARLAADHGVQVDFVEADATVYDPPAPVDLVMLVYLQLDPAERQTVLGHAATWLEPGGTIFVIAHDRSNVTDGHGGPPSAEVCYTVEETLAAFDRLEVTTAEVAERVVATDDGDRIALDTLVIAHRPVSAT